MAQKSGANHEGSHRELGHVGADRDHAVRSPASPAPVTRCLRCGRALRASASIAAGYGRKCRARVLTAIGDVDLTDYSPAQYERAIEALREAAIVPTSRPGQYSAVSSDGTVIYLVTVGDCTCPARRACYHRAAVEILTAALAA